jgi:hypothetical protein
MSGALTSLEILNVVLDADAELESLGPGASKVIAKELSALGFIDEATKTYIENNSWVGWVGLGVGLLTVAALSVPLGGIATGGIVGAAAETITTAAISTADNAIISLYAGSGYEAIGAFTSAEIATFQPAMQAVSSAVIKAAISNGAAALVAENAPNIGKFFQQLIGDAPGAYAGTESISPPDLPTNIDMWDTTGGSQAYTRFTTALTSTNLTINVSTLPNGIVQEMGSTPTGPSFILTFNADGSTTTTTYSGPKGTGTVTKIDRENADSTSQITTYNSDGSPIVTTYSGPNGTGTIIGISISSLTAKISSEPGDITYVYKGTGVSAVVVYNSCYFRWWPHLLWRNT